MAEPGFNPTSAPESRAPYMPSHCLTCSDVNMGFKLSLFLVFLSFFKSSDRDEFYRTLQLGGRNGRNICLEPYATNGICPQESLSGVTGEKGLNSAQTSQIQSLAE